MAMHNHPLKDPDEMLLALDEIESDFSESSESSDSENDILDEDSVISEGNSTENEQKLGENSKIPLTKRGTYSRRGKWFDLNEGPYNNVLEPEDSYSSSENHVDNNEKSRKSKKRKRKACTKSTMKSKKPASKKAKPMKFSGQMRKIWEHLLHFHQFRRPTFRKTTLPIVGNGPKLIDFFSFYLMDEVFEFLAYETNRMM